MTTAVGAEKRRAPPSSTIVLLVLAGVAGSPRSCGRALDMSLEAGTMGLSIGEFVVMWTLMMAAMMLPAVSPLVSMYARSVRGSASAPTAFGAGYVLAWAATGFVAYALTWLFDELAEERTDAAHGSPSGRSSSFGVYQLTPMKRWCLRHCRSPISHLLHYAAYRGRTRHLRAGAHHGLVCVGCCWGMMLALLAVGLMNIPAMVGAGVADHAREAMAVRRDARQGRRCRRPRLCGRDRVRRRPRARADRQGRHGRDADGRPHGGELTTRAQSMAAYRPVQKSWITAGGGNADVNMSVVRMTPITSSAGSLPHDEPSPPAQP